MRGLPIAVVVCCAMAGAAPAQPTPAFGITVVIPSGLEGKIYHIRHNTSHLPDFGKMKAKGMIYTTSLNIPAQAFDQGFPGVTKRFEWFAIDYSGKFWVSKPGSYSFQLTSDDGSKLFVDDALVNDQLRDYWGKQAIREWAERDIIGDRMTLSVIEVVEHYGNFIVTASVDGDFDKRGLPDPLVLCFYFTPHKGRIAQLIILRNRHDI